MKLITFAVPCYNSEAYMHKCVDSLLRAGQDAEILIVDDGSTDSTAQIADDYAAKYPSRVTAIHQPNGGHGAAVNTGLAHASGEFYKVVDSDDWLDEDLIDEYMQILRKVRGQVDLVITDYIYDKQGKKHKTVMRYTNALPQRRVFTWDEVGSFGPGEVMIMHALTYRTGLLRDAGFRLPEHTFYVDNLVAYIPLKYVKTICYADIALYHYFIGREDQSVNINRMVARQDQQVAVMRRMISDVTLEDLPNKHQRKYMTRYFEMLMTVTSVVLLKDGGDAALRKKHDVWEELRNTHPETYRIVKRHIMGRLCASESRVVGRITLAGYTLGQKVVGYN